MSLLPIVLVRQNYEFSCGPACVASILYYYQVWDGKESDLYGLCETDDGTSGHSIVKALQHFGLKAESQANLTIDDLKSEVEKGHCLILDIQAWEEEPVSSWKDHWDDGHYVILAGFENGLVYMMDPSTPARYIEMTEEDLLKRWHDWGDDDPNDDDAPDTKDYHWAVIVSGDNPIKQYPASPFRL